MKSTRKQHNFNSTHKVIFMVALLFSINLISPSIYAANQTSEVNQEESEAKLDKLKAGIKKMTNWLLNANDEKTGLNKELKQIELKINQLSKDIRDGLSQIATNKEELSLLSKQLKELNKKIETQQSFLKKQIQVAYFQEEHSKIKLLLNTNNPQDIARQMRYFDFIKDARKEKLDEIISLLNTIQTTELDIRSKTLSLEEKTKQLETRKLELSTSTDNKQKLLAKLEHGIKNNTQRLEKMQADQKRLKDLLIELEASLSKDALPNDSGPLAKQKSKLPWPSHGKVVAEYGSSVANGKLSLNGIRFNTKDGDAVTSIYSGRVIFANWIRGFGLLLIVDHGNQYMSLYGNNKSLTKQTGNRVRVGETIAISSEYNPNLETGLYFEIRKQGKPLNPRQWLRN